MIFRSWGLVLPLNACNAEVVGRFRLNRLERYQICRINC